jgi:uncharacterized protein (DUF169 family)
MSDLKKLDEALNQHIHPETFPLAIKMAKKGEALPEKIKRPVKDLGVKVATCQGFSLARRYGWSLAIFDEDISCPLTKVAFGFEKEVKYFTDGLACEGMYTASSDAGKKTEAEVPKFGYKEYESIWVAPVGRTNFTPDVICVYGNSAQVMRLLTAALYKSGGYLVSRSAGRIDCADIVIETMKSGRPHYILPCYGDRIFGLTQDYEMAFAFPYSFSDALIEGLEGTHKGGVRYPIPSFLRFQAQYPERYQKLAEFWKKEGGE